MKTPCTDIQAHLIDLLFGNLDTEQADRIRQHLGSCSVCRSIYEHYYHQEKELERMGTQLTTDLEQKQDKAIQALQDIPDKAMRRPRLLRYAVAAGVLLAVGLSLTVLDIPFDGATKAYAMNDVPDLLYAAATLHIKGTLYIDSPNGAEAADVEHWIDVRNGRWHARTPSYTITGGNVDIYMTETIYDGQDYKLSIDHREQTGTYYRVSPFQSNLQIERIQDNLVRFVCGTRELMDTYQLRGQETVDGSLYNIWEGRVDTGPVRFKMRTWLSPHTGRMARAVIWQSTDSELWTKSCEMDVIEMNVPIKDAVFALTMPDGYTAANTVETAVKSGLSKSMGGFDSIHLEHYLSFMLPENRLVLCWRNELLENPEDEAGYFNDLHFGGPLPPLPAEIQALRTSIDGQDYLWRGKHLAYTRKDGRCYEWALYVPEQVPPLQPNHVYTYSLVIRMNTGLENSVSMSFSPDVNVENQTDFENFIIEGLRELSDDPDMPAPFTLQEVLSLSRDD